MAPFRVVNVVNVDPLKVVGLVIVERPPLLDLRTASLGSPKAKQGNYSDMSLPFKSSLKSITSLDDVHIDMLRVGG